MNQTVQGEQWVWVIVQNPGADEQFLGQYDEEKKESFIPVFLEKEEAQQALEKMAHEPGLKYEAQAIQLEDLKGRAAESGRRSPGGRGAGVGFADSG